jgi:Raf kinase inhibitor-like YbhB/YbcL family protein
MQLAFYKGNQFPAEYRGDAFFALRGSWNRNPPAGYEITRIHFEAGKPIKFEPFVQGFLSKESDRWFHHGRLAGLAQAKDGSLLFSDDTGGVIYRVAYTGKSNTTKTLGVPTNSNGANIRILNAPQLNPDDPHIANLAVKLLANGNLKALSLTSPAFKEGSVIPATYAAKGENISPPLKWESGPAGTKSYAILMEDPDVRENPPFVHWSIYNLPSNLLELPPGIPPVAELVKPKDAKQGKNDFGSVGYIGPNPPAGDGAHRYFFQIFALDTKLNLPIVPTREELIEAMRGHVLSVGYTVGTYDQ